MEAEQNKTPNMVWSANRFPLRRGRRWPWVTVLAAFVAIFSIMLVLSMIATEDTALRTAGPRTTVPRTTVPRTTVPRTAVVPGPAFASTPAPAPVLAPALTPKVQPPAPVAAATTPRYWVQLSSMRKETEAQTHFSRLQNRHPDLSQLRAHVRRADLGERGTYYRLQVGPFPRREAVSVCDGLKQRGETCFVRRR